MKHSLPWTVIFLTCGLLAGRGDCCGQSPAAQPPDAASSLGANAVDGQALVAQAAERMTALPSLEARIRQRVSLFEQDLVGAGVYYQWQSSAGWRFRFELRLQAGEETNSMHQVNDGRFLWVRKAVAGQSQLSRIDLRRVDQVLRRPAALPAAAALGVGGLPQLLRGLHEHFEFSTAQPDQVGGVAVWTLRGRWRQESLARLWPETADRIKAGDASVMNDLPPQLPHLVNLVLGRDQPLPLFPYRVEYVRFAQHGPSPQPIAVMEFFEARIHAELDPALFQFPVTDENVLDATDWYLDRHLAPLASLPPSSSPR